MSLSLPFNTIKKVFPFIQKGGWAIVDHGIFAVANYLLNIFLARELLLKEYGVFVVTFSVFLLLGNIHTGLITEPMLVFGSGKYKNNTSDYLGILIYGHIVFSMIVILIVALGTIFFELGALGLTTESSFAIAFSSIGILFMWLMRRASYMNLMPILSATTAILYSILLVTGMSVLHWRGGLSSVNALLLMGGASVLAAIWLVFRMKVNFTKLSKTMFKNVIIDHWAYGKWTLAAAGFRWLPRNIYFIILPILLNIEASAILRAQINLVDPLLNAIAALTIFLIPVFVKQIRSPNLLKLVYILVAMFVILGGVYWLLINLFRTTIITFLYGHNDYSNYALTLAIISILPILTGIIAVLGGIISAQERADNLFWAFFLGSIVGLLCGLVAISIWGLVGAALGIIISYVVVIVVMSYLLRATFFHPMKISVEA